MKSWVVGCGLWHVVVVVGSGNGSGRRWLAVGDLHTYRTEGMSDSSDATSLALVSTVWREDGMMCKSSVSRR